MRPDIRIVFAAISVAVAIAACSMPEPPQRTALVFGIADYEGTSNDLAYTDDDATDIADTLIMNGWTTSLKLDEDSDLSGITSAISALAGTDGIVLFYYSGHGGLVNGKANIIPYGTVSDSTQWITASELTAMFKAAGLKNVVIVLDSCFSGGFVEEGATVDAIPDVFGENDGGDIAYTWFVDALGDAINGYTSYSGDSGYIVISAAGAGEASWESSTYGHGIFTYALLRGAASGGSDLDGDGYVTTSELYAYCAAFIDANWNSTQEHVYDTNLEQYQDYMPHLSGTAREYALWAVD